MGVQISDSSEDWYENDYHRKEKTNLTRKVPVGVLKVEQGLLKEQLLVKQLNEMKT